MSPTHNREDTNRPKVAIFQHFLSHYRVGIFETIVKSQEFQYEFWLGEKGKHVLFSLHHNVTDEVDFPIRPSPMRTLQLPFLSTPIILIPGQMRAAVSREVKVLIFPAIYNQPFFLAATVIARLMGKKVIYWGHGINKGGPDRPWRSWLIRTTARLANAILLYGKREANYYDQKGFPMRKVFVSNNALDTRPVKAILEGTTPADIKRFQEEKKLRGKKALIFTGRLLASKEVIVAVEAMPAILKQEPDAILVIIGDGPDAERIRKRIDELALTNHVQMPGAIFDEEVLARYYLSSQIAVIPGSAGLVINHAFAYSVPVITSDDLWRHGPEIAMLEDGKTGLLFHDGNPDSLADCVIELLSNPDRLAEMKTSCRRLIDEEYNEVAMAEAFHSAVRYVLSH